ncbi:hypothetical protein [Nocardia sp. NPDC004604]|uniref:hypothetical protein n=1 Tax=Nocardia sp. NPDC004604 TaxID=3157013 RepID=UPI0033B66B35
MWLFAIIVRLIAVPAAGVAGTAGYTAVASRIRAENATKVAVPAMSPERVVTVDAYGAAAARFEATVRWDQHRRSGTTTTEVPDKSAPGDEVQVWLNGDRKATTPPVRPTDAADNGIVIGMPVLVAIWSGATLLSYGVGRVRCARRYAALDRERRGMSRPAGQDS